MPNSKFTRRHFSQICVFSVAAVSSGTCFEGSAFGQKIAASNKPAAAEAVPNRKLAFKKIGDVELKLHVFDPVDSKRTGAVVVFFFGGGWVGGTPSQFYPQCQLLAERGMLAISAEYRVRTKHETTPFECVADGKSAVRWIRENATSLNIDPNKIVAV